MKEQKLNRGVCALLITWMLLLGMCFQGVEADSSFLRVFEQQEEIPASSFIRAAGNTSLSQQAYLKESGGSREAETAIRQTRGKTLHRALREGRGSSFLASLVDQPFLGRFFGLIDNDTVGTIHSNMVILEYIHQKDGKKA
mgnify:FL=1